MGNPKSKGRRRFWWATIILLLAASGGSAWYFFIRKKEPVVTVQTEKVQRRNLTEIVVANGKIQPVVQVVINPEVSGEIVELPVKDGQEVKKGDLLVKLKPDNYRAARNSIEANYFAALAARNLAQANLSKAEAEYKRSKELFGEKLVSDSQYLEAETIFAVAKATFESSSHQADQAKASLAKAEDDLLKTTILSPMDGTVTRLRSQLGERVVGTALMSGTEIMTIVNLNDMIISAHVNQADVIRLAAGQEVDVQLESVPGLKLRGKVERIAPQAVLKNGIKGFTARIQLTDIDPRVRPGMTAILTIPVASAQNVLAVPLGAIHSDHGERFVFVKQGDDFVARPVVIGITDYANAEVREGLAEGDIVALEHVASDAIAKLREAKRTARVTGTANANPPAASGATPPPATSGRPSVRPGAERVPARASGS